MGTVATLDSALYALPMAARYLRVAPTTLQYWLEGGTKRGVTYQPVVRPEATGSRDLTWGEFVECWYIRQYRKEHGVPMADIRTLILRLRDELGVKYPLAHKKAFVAAGQRLASRIQDEDQLSQRSWIVVNELDGQLGLSPIAESFLAEVDFAAAGGIVMRIAPHGADSPVSIEPEISFGAPQIRGIRTENLAELVTAGDEIEVVAEDFGLAVAELQAALAYEWGAPGSRAA